MALPYTIWQVGEKEMKLRLTTRQAVAVEEKLGVNLLKGLHATERRRFSSATVKSNVGGYPRCFTKI